MYLKTGLYRNNFGYTFPFEGNWNQGHASRKWIRLCPALDILSRLKGIETRIVSRQRRYRPSLDILSRLKGIETSESNRVSQRRLSNPLDILSRLKGIETQPYQSCTLDNMYLWIYFPVWRELKLTVALLLWVKHNSPFGYTFPFEGNWNAWLRLSPVLSTESLDILSRLKGIETDMVLLKHGEE